LIDFLITAITCIAVGAAFSLGVIKAYRQGVKDGRAIKEDTPLEPVFDKKIEESPDPMISAYETIANYDPFKKEVK